MELIPINVADDFGLKGIIHFPRVSGPGQKWEAAWFDNIDGNAQTRRKPQNSADIACDIRLEQGNSHGTPLRNLCFASQAMKIDVGKSY